METTFARANRIPESREANENEGEEMLKKINKVLKKMKVFTWDRMDGSSKVLAVAIAAICAFTVSFVMYLDHERAAAREIIVPVKNEKMAEPIQTTATRTMPAVIGTLHVQTSRHQAKRPIRRRRSLHVKQASFIDGRGIKHNFIAENETLCRISKKEYGTTAFALDIAWFNGFEDPDRIVKDGKILLPPSDKLLTAPFGWPEVPATAAQITSRALLVGEDLPQQTLQPADGEDAQTEPAETTQLAASPETRSLAPTCRTRHHIVVEGELTISDVARNEYQRDLHGLGLALGAANRMEGRTNVSLGTDLMIPCLGEIRPVNLVSMATAPPKEAR